MRLFWQLTVLCTIALWADSALAQRQPIPDDTLGGERSIVTPSNNLPVAGDRISGGARRGDNLFHSFREFGVETGRSVYFVDPGVRNIISRVTGGNPSEIFGTLGVQGGNANLFLINPNGIVFGAGASLDVRGSFVGTTADSLVFDNGFTFSATNPQAPSLLTVSAPIGLQYGMQTPGAITVNQTALLVDSGQSLILAGGEITLNNGGLRVRDPQGGQIDLGALSEAGTVGLEQNGNIFSLIFPEALARADVQITNRSSINVVAENGGSVALNARNLDILRSSIQAGIRQGRGTANSQAGNIVLNGTENIRVGQSSVITNNVGANGTGNSGNIDITAGSLFVTDGTQLQTLASGRGNAGNVIIYASDRVVFNGTGSAALSRVQQGVIGRGGSINIDTDSLVVSHGARLTASTFGQGDAGDVIIHADDRVLFDGGDAFSNVGDVDFSGRTTGQGGNIRITTGSLEVGNGAQLQASTFGQGNAGNVILNARDRIVFSNGIAFSTVGSINFDGVAVGHGGNVRITTGSLEVVRGAQLTASTFGRGNAGNIIINADDRVLFDSTGAFSTVGGVAFDGVAEGRGGNVRITAGSLEIINDAELV